MSHELDCSKFRGRQKEWCLGIDRHGNPLPSAKVAAYREYLQSGRQETKKLHSLNTEQRKLQREKKRAERIRQSHEAWRLLHAYPIDHADSWDEQTARRWFRKWESRIPRYGCQCRAHWSQIKKKLKPDFSAAQAYYRWTVDAHNEVNKLLGKPLFTIDRDLVEASF